MRVGQLDVVGLQIRRHVQNAVDPVNVVAVHDHVHGEGLV
jgi:hypothetical protein